jgi:hypothetical protein
LTLTALKSFSASTAIIFLSVIVACSGGGQAAR